VRFLYADFKELNHLILLAKSKVSRYRGQNSRTHYARNIGSDSGCISHRNAVRFLYGGDRSNLLFLKPIGIPIGFKY